MEIIQQWWVVFGAFGTGAAVQVVVFRVRVHFAFSVEVGFVLLVANCIHSNIRHRRSIIVEERLSLTLF